MTARCRQVTGAPSFCFQCNAQLMRAPGEGAGLFFAHLVDDRKAGVVRRIHGECLRPALDDGLRLISHIPQKGDVNPTNQSQP